MRQSDIIRFRRRCGQFRWLAAFMMVSVGLVVALHVFVTLVAWRSGEWAGPVGQEMTEVAIGVIPAAFYLWGVWSIGQAMGQLARGRLIQPTLTSALRRVGLALGLGGLASVFGVINLMRVLGFTSSYLHFDVAGMTLGMIGGALFLLGRVVEQAAHIQAELDEMI